MKITITEDYRVNFANLDARIIEVGRNAKAFKDEKTVADEQIQAICDKVYEEICARVYPLAYRYKTLCENTGWKNDIKTTDFKIGANGSVRIFVQSDYIPDWYDLHGGNIFYGGKTTSYFKTFVKALDKENYLQNLEKAFKKETVTIDIDINEKRLKKQEELNKFLGL